ncbi:MAG: GAF domain-containing protein [Pseudomonadota bacterium]
MTDADRLNDIQSATNPFLAVEQHMGDIIGHKLFTLMVIDRETNEAARAYSSNPKEYPVKGRKPLGALSEWGEQVLTRGLPYVGYTAKDIRSVFFDHEVIARLGCASVLNVPVISDRTVIGTINLLHEENWYKPDHAERAAPFAALLVPSFLDWAKRA